MRHTLRSSALSIALAGAVAFAYPSATGQGAPLCTSSVVHCNYAKLYSGSVDWEVRLDGPKYHRVETVSVTVQKGAALCSGSVTETDQNGTTTGTIGGRGIIAVEFEQDTDVGKYYLVTAACPSAAGMGSPVTPAELDGREYSSDKQASALKPGSLLKGMTTSHPDDDPVNGATSTVKVTWNLKSDP